MKQGQAGRWRWRRVRRRENNTFSWDAWDRRSTAGTRKQRKERNHVSVQVRVHVPATQGSIHRTEGGKEIDGSPKFHLLTSSHYRYSLLCPGSRRRFSLSLSITSRMGVSKHVLAVTQTHYHTALPQHSAAKFLFFAIFFVPHKDKAVEGLKKKTEDFSRNRM